MSEIRPMQLLWRIPQQARSRDRFNKILNSAAELLVEQGYDSVTADEIAAHAETSVGGLYRFFPDKLAVFCALLDRYLNQLRDLFAALHTPDVMQLSLEEYVGQVVDRFDQFVTDNPAFRVVLVQSRLMPISFEMNAAFNQEIAQQLAAFFAARNPNLDQTQRELIATISVEVASALDFLALSGDRAFQQKVLTETKKLLVAYLRSSLEEDS